MKKLFNNYIDSFTGLSKEIWWLSLITFINRSGAMVIPFLSLYLTADLDFNLKQVGWIMVCYGIGSTLGSYLGGFLTDLMGYYKTMVTSLVLGGLGFISLQFLEDFYALCIGVFLVMTIVDIYRPASFVAVVAYSKPENKKR